MENVHKLMPSFLVELYHYLYIYMNINIYEKKAYSYY